MKIAIQGELGSNHHKMIHKLVDLKNNELFCAKSFPELFEAIVDKKADFGIIAIENSIAGSLIYNFDLLSKYNYQIIAEGYLRIEHCLIGFPGTKVEDIKIAFTQDIALKQCTEFLNDNHIEGRDYYDTAASVPYVKESGNKSYAGIASSMAAEIYGMEIIKKGIETNKDNYTRFVVICPQENVDKAKAIINFTHKAELKTMMEFEVKHEKGSLAQVLNKLAELDFNLTKIESRPIVGDKWHYRFFVDFVCEKSVEEITKGVKEVEENVDHLKVHGIFPVGDYFMD